MRIKIFTTLMILIGILLLQAETVDLFFSEYVEGSSQNKAIEIFNGTGETVDLDNYRIAMAVNDGGWQFYHAFPDGASIADGDVWVIGNTGSVSEIADVADENGPYDFPGPAGFSGDDARALEKTTDGSSWDIIDIIGNPTENVSGWYVAGIEDATKDHTLVRKEDVNQGLTDWDVSAGTDVVTSQWTVYNVDTYSFLGSHSYNGGIDITPPVVISATAISATIVEIVFSEALEETSATNLANYEVTPALTLSDPTLNLNKVTFYTSEQTDSEEYFITINNVKDLADNEIAANSDIQFTGYVGIQSTSIADIQNNLEEYENQQVTIHGIVTIGDDLLYPGRTKFYVQDQSGRGVQVFNFDPPTESRQRGDEVVVTGSIELYTGSSGDYYDVQIGGDEIEIISSGNELPTPINLSQNFPLDYNGTWAYTIGTIVDVWNQGTFIQIKIDNGTLETPVMFWNSTGADVANYELGDVVQSRGVITYYRGSIQLLSGYTDDIGDYEVVPEPIKAKLDITPEPFSPRLGQTIKIISETGSNNKMILRIYNAEGKLVATPVNKTNTEVTGTDIFHWNGRDKYGHLLPIGLYICSLEVIEISSGKKKTATAPIVVATKLK